MRGRIETLGVVRLVAATERPPAVTEPATETPSGQVRTATPTPSTDRRFPGLTMTIAILRLLLAFGLLRLR
jgi:hypothetical protein